MMQTIMTNKKRLMVVCCTLLLLAVLLGLTGVATAQEMDEDFMGIMEQIADDIEEIHEDMHKVSFALRLISYSSIGIFFVLLGQAAIVVMKK